MPKIGFLEGQTTSCASHYLGGLVNLKRFSTKTEIEQFVRTLFEKEKVLKIVKKTVDGN